VAKWYEDRRKDVYAKQAKEPVERVREAYMADEKGGKSSGCVMGRGKLGSADSQAPLLVGFEERFQDEKSAMEAVDSATEINDSSKGGSLQRRILSSMSLRSMDIQWETHHC
jgi:hypothetical protein